jgi:integrase
VARIVLTDKFVKSRKAGAEHAFHFDALVPGLLLHVTPKGKRTFMLGGRYPLRPKTYVRRALGQYGELSLEAARERARAWLELIARGIDPEVQAARERAAAERAQANTFQHVAHEFLTRHTDKLAKAKEARAIIEREFVRRWGARPITHIQAQDVASAIRAIAKRSEAMAHISLGYLRRLFSWSVNVHEFGIEASPVAVLRPADLIGQRVVRERVLTDDELRAVWDAAGRDGYPFGSIVRMLILTGQRLNEIAALSWSEIDLDRQLITIPSGRMKGGRAHEVPLPPDALALLTELPRFTRGQYAFSTTGGTKPFVGHGKGKARIDRLSGVTEWRLHDLRRTMRTHLSALPVQDLVRELVIAHARPGLHRVYDQHSYLDEKRECLNRWETRLRGILNPVPGDVADLAEVRARKRVEA